MSEKKQLLKVLFLIGTVLVLTLSIMANAMQTGQVAGISIRESSAVAANSFPRSSTPVPVGIVTGSNAKFPDQSTLDFARISNDTSPSGDYARFAQALTAAISTNTGIGATNVSLDYFYGLPTQSINSPSAVRFRDQLAKQGGH